MKFITKCIYCESEEFERGNRNEILCSQCGEMIYDSDDLKIILGKE